MLVVSIFMCDRVFGGHEEGGWWYDCGHPDNEHAHHTRWFENEDDAFKYVDMLNNLIIKPLNEDRPSTSSVLSRGQYQAIIQDGGMPRAFPEETPYYS